MGSSSQSCPVSLPPSLPEQGEITLRSPSDSRPAQRREDKPGNQEATETHSCSHGGLGETFDQFSNSRNHGAPTWPGLKGEEVKTGSTTFYFNPKLGFAYNKIPTNGTDKSVLNFYLAPADT